MLRNNRRDLLKTGTILLAGLAGSAFLPSNSLQTQASSTSKADTIQVTISRTVEGTSRYAPGLTNADSSLYYNSNKNDTTAINNVKILASKGLSYINTQVLGWGADDMWPDPAESEPYNWASLDQKLKFAVSTRTIPVITLCEAPWWMKGQLNADGSTTLLTSDDEWDTITYNSRILDNMMGAWLKLVQRIAERYMVAPYHVRYFQVWNELKGYWNDAVNGWDYQNQRGDPSGFNAKHGYTYMYNLVYKKLKATATSLGIPAHEIKVGGPYIGLTTTVNDITTELKKAYGNYEQRDLDVVKYWLKHKAGGEFIALDARNINYHDYNPQSPGGPFAATEVLADATNWVRSLDETQHPGATTLPIWFAEWYAFPYTNFTDAYNNAVKSYAIAKFIKAGGSCTLEWTGTGENGVGGLWTPTTTGGGHPLPWYYSCRAFKKYFKPGTALYRTTSSSSSIEVLACAAKTMLINKTQTRCSVSVNGTTITLGAYQVKVIKTP